MTTQNTSNRDADHRLSGDPAYDDAMARARGAMADLDGLPPSAWARIRAGVDEAAAAEAGASFWAAWRPLFTVGAVAAAAVALFLMWPGAEKPPHIAPGPAPGSMAQAEPETPKVAPVEAPAPELVAVAPAAKTGDTLTAKDDTLEIDAFGRHAITLAAGSKARVIRFDQGGVVLELLSGSVRSDVQRRDPSEIYEVRTGQVTARVVGTVFTVAHKQGGATAVSVEHGIVAATGADGVEQRLTEGQSADFGSTPEAPVRAEPASESKPTAKAPSRPGRKSHAASRRAKAAKKAATATPEPEPVPAADDGEGSLKIIEIDVPDQAAPTSE